jgi:hypothetical protein
MVAKLKPYAMANEALHPDKSMTKDSVTTTYDKKSGLYSLYAASSSVDWGVNIRVTLYCPPVLSNMCEDIILNSWVVGDG